MKYQFAICALLSIAVSPMSAQLVASHASTPITQQSSRVAQSSTMGQPGGKVVARVNGAVLTDQDLLREEYAIFPYARQHNGNIPKEMESGIRQGALQMIVFEELVYQEARRRNLSIAPEKLKKAESEFRQQFGDPTQYQQYLKAECQGSERILRDKIRRSLLIEQFLKTEVDAKSAISDAELQAYYGKHAERFQYPESFAIQTISVFPPANATAAQLKEARVRAEDAVKQAKATKTAEEFGLLAEKISDDDYRVMMGDHKWVGRDKMPPQMVTAALGMQPGAVSDLIQVDQKYVVFRMNKHVPAGKVKLADARAQLLTELKKTKASQVRAALDKKLRQNAKVEIL